MNSTTSFDFTSFVDELLDAHIRVLLRHSLWPASALNPTLSYMYPKPLCIQSKLGGSWYAPPSLSEGRATPRSPHPGLDHRPRRLFIPDRSPYLGQG